MSKKTGGHKAMGGPKRPSYGAGSPPANPNGAKAYPHGSNAKGKSGMHG